MQTINITQHEVSSTLFIERAAIRENLRRIRQILPPYTRILGMVKADAYGTHLLEMTNLLDQEKVFILGVAYVSEGIALKKNGAPQDVFVSHATPSELAAVVEWDLETAVGDSKTIRLLAIEALKQRKKIKVHLNIDTGMRRFGCMPQDALKLAQEIAGHPMLTLEGIMTHFARADDPEDDFFTHEQAHIFDQILDQLKQNHILFKWAHAANSAATLRLHKPNWNMVRIGLSMYGLHTLSKMRTTFPLIPAVSLRSKIIAFNETKSGDSVSYGRLHTVTHKKGRVAIIPIGYCDGLLRSYSQKNEVVIRGKKAPMVGRICMDFSMIDVTHIPEAEIGDEVLLFGSNEQGDFISPEVFAENGGTIAHELITCLGPRIQRVLI